MLHISRKLWLANSKDLNDKEKMIIFLMTINHILGID